MPLIVKIILWFDNKNPSSSDKATLNANPSL